VITFGILVIRESLNPWLGDKMELTLKRVGLESEQLVQQVLNDAPQFHRIVEGCEARSHFAKRELTELPKGTTADQKHNFLAFHNDKPIAFVDLINGHPNPQTAYIGLLVIAESEQAKGYGKKIYYFLEKYIANCFKSSRIRLGVAVENPVEGFWLKMGFVYDGKSTIYKAENKETLLRTMHKELHSAEVY
jgi:GNAT superfamily N-acetyltransferase